MTGRNLCAIDYRGAALMFVANDGVASERTGKNGPTPNNVIRNIL